MDTQKLFILIYDTREEIDTVVAGRWAVMSDFAM